MIYEVILVFVLVLGAIFRYVGIQWGDWQYLHPDERFLVWVGTDIQPIGTPQDQLGAPPNTVNNPWRSGVFPDCPKWGGYFDASCSPLNPANRGHSFYVYGDFPMMFTRYLVQWIYGHSGFNEMTTVGRVLSAFVDLLSAMVVYGIGKRLFSQSVGLLAATFYAFTVLNIQQSHFFTMDTFFNFFTILAVYYAVRVVLVEHEQKELQLTHAGSSNALVGEDEVEQSSQSLSSHLVSILKSPYLGLSIAFGISLGCAVASKLSAAPVAFVLPLAFGVVVLRKPHQMRYRWLVNSMVYLGIAAFVSILVFRILQPYAFSGPGFLGLKPNPQWVENIKYQREQATGDVDYPPSLQWAHRPIWFSAQNMVEWGLGIPLGILAFASFLWAGWRMVKGHWSQQAILWLWGAFYFIWQSMQFNPTMRYQLPTYPILAIYAGWGLVELFTLKKRWQPSAPAAEITGEPSRFKWARPVTTIVGSLVILATFLWAVAFSLMYSRPITRVAASEWIYQNIPGPINLQIQTSTGQYNQPLSLPYGYAIQPGTPYQTSFLANATGALSQVYLGHVASTQASQPTVLDVSLANPDNPSRPLLTQMIPVSPGTAGSSVMGGHLLNFSSPVTMNAGQVYILTMTLAGSDRVLDACGPITIILRTAVENVSQSIDGPDQCTIRPGMTYTLDITPQTSGMVDGFTLSQLVDQTPTTGQQTLVLTIGPSGDDQVVVSGSLTAHLVTQADGLGAGYTIALDHPINVVKGKMYSLSVSLESGSGAVSIQGSAVANEGEWDDGLPLRVEGYDAFSGIYTSALNFNMYTDDSQTKLDHFVDVMDQTEYIVISSNRQWGSLPRLPERFPMTTIYYRSLLGCPAQEEIGWCYSVAQPGKFQGDLGFQLVAIFQSDPVLGHFRINDQFAEEAFTVYDHPKVLIFKKSASYSSANARQILSIANFGEMVRITPKKAADHPANLLLPEVRQFIQSVGGTWSQLFNPQGLLNRVQPLGVIAWYLSVSLIGLLVYPILRLTLPGLADKGYPLARTVGMLMLAFLTWLAGSVNIPFSRLTITVVILLMAASGIYLAYRQRDELREEWYSKRRYFLIVEGLALAFFLFFLFVRLGNPDLWHPYKGGEKPMDFSYFNAVLKSTTFPPYDPWYDGGYMNYYYWGYVFVGVLVKWLGIVPSIAYNLILPTLFSIVALGAFSIGFNLTQMKNLVGSKNNDPPPGESEESYKPTNRPYLIGLAASLGMVVLGNLGTLRMLAKGWEQLGIPGGLTDSTPFFTRVSGLFAGLGNMLFHGARMPYALADWYWIPSRAIPAPNDVEPITEFPLFTFLYADLHAHMIAMAIGILAIAWTVAILMGKARWQSISAGIGSIFLGGLAIGALYPTNLSDIYTYLPIGMIVLGYTLFRYADIGWLNWLPKVSTTYKRLSLAIVGALALAFLSYELFLPYRLWYAQPYSSVIPWSGTHTPLVSYLTHWGLFLFVMISWMVWETRQWMADTPLSSLRKLEKYSGLIILFIVLILLACLLLSVKIPGLDTSTLLHKIPIGRGASMAWFILPLAAWAGVLILRPGQPDAKRLVLFLVGTGLIITLMVEVVVVQGDIGRMNTVFKFYMQAWLLFAVCSAAALGWLLEPLRHWLPTWRNTWRVAFGFLVFSAILFTVYGTMAKSRDRWEPAAPHTLDGMAYMPYATYFESYPNVNPNTPPEQAGINMDLGQDYRAIRWMQENITGSPVIVEANSRNLYRWYTRFTINTGLPGVVGWEWHQQQQRALMPPEWVTKRITDINKFYTSVDVEYVKQFLSLYDVRYIVVGQLEGVTYPGPGLEKFPEFNGKLWNQVYHDGDTTIYEVIK